MSTIALGNHMSGSETRAVQFDRYNGLDVLYLADVAEPQSAAGEVVVAVRAAGSFRPSGSPTSR